MTTEYCLKHNTETLMLLRICFQCTLSLPSEKSENLTNCFPTNCVSDHFVGLALKWLRLKNLSYSDHWSRAVKFRLQIATKSQNSSVDLLSAIKNLIWKRIFNFKISALQSEVFATDIKLGNFHVSGEISTSWL